MSAHERGESSIGVRRDLVHDADVGRVPNCDDEDVDTERAQLRRRRHDVVVRRAIGDDERRAMAPVVAVTEDVPRGECQRGAGEGAAASVRHRLDRSDDVRPSCERAKLRFDVLLVVECRERDVHVKVRRVPPPEFRDDIGEKLLHAMERSGTDRLRRVDEEERFGWRRGSAAHARDRRRAAVGVHAIRAA